MSEARERMLETGRRGAEAGFLDIEEIVVYFLEELFK